MDTALVVMVSLLVAGLALAFYMDWLGLWVSKEEMTAQIALAKDRMRANGESTGNKGATAVSEIKE